MHGTGLTIGNLSLVLSQGLISSSLPGTELLWRGGRWSLHQSDRKTLIPGTQVPCKQPHGVSEFVPLRR